MSDSFRIRQNNTTVVKATGPNAESLIWHYAFQYRADGDLTIQRRATGGHWKRFALLARWPGKEHAK